MGCSCTLAKVIIVSNYSSDLLMEASVRSGVTMFEEDLHTIADGLARLHGRVSADVDQ